jgi:hypothetical protein
VGQPDDARAFLSTGHAMLGGKRPIEVAVTELGARRVESLLWSLFHGGTASGKARSKATAAQRQGTQAQRVWQAWRIADGRFDPLSALVASLAGGGGIHPGSVSSTPVGRSRAQGSKAWPMQASGAFPAPMWRSRSPSRAP